MRQTRRDVLRRSGQLTALGVALSTAGCSGDSVLGGGDDSPEEDEEDSGPPLAPSEWVGAPGVIGDSEHGFFNHSRIDELLDNQESLPESISEDISEATGVSEAAGLDPEDAVAELSWRDITLMQGTFSKEDAVSALEDSGFEEEETNGDFTILVGTQESEYPSTAVGVSSDKLIHTEDSLNMSPAERVSVAVDVGNGDEDRYADESEDLQALLDQMGIGTVNFGRTFEETEETDTEYGQFEGTVASGSRYDVNGETTTIEVFYLYASEDAVNTDDVQTFVDEIESEDNVFGSSDGEASVSQSGRAAVIEVTGSTAEVQF